MMYDAPTVAPGDLVPPIEPVANAPLSKLLHRHLAGKTKPPGALGRLEALAVQIGLIVREEQPRLVKPQMLVFAGDHGITAQGVSGYPQEVTRQMVENMLAGGAAVRVLCRQHGITLTVVDAGVRGDISPRPGLLIHKIGRGTRDASVEPAMTRAQCASAVTAGRDIVRSRPGNVLLLGEMGIGNTSAAALLMARLTHRPVGQCVGHGAGLDEAGLERKRRVLEATLAHHGHAQEPLAVLATLGGFEIAMLVGALLQGAHERRVLVIDGFIVTVALLVAHALAPSVLDYCVFSHRSEEPGHAPLLARLEAEPLMNLSMRLGEGSGAAVAWPLVESAARLLSDMASFEQVGVSRCVP